MPSTRSSAATKCISEVPGLAKHTLTPPPTSVRTRLSAPFIPQSPRSHWRHPAGRIKVEQAPTRSPHRLTAGLVNRLAINCRSNCCLRDKGIASGSMRLGEMLIIQGLATQAEIDAALARQQRFGGRIGTHLIALGVLTADQLLHALSSQHASGAVVDLCLPAMEGLESEYGADHPNSFRAHYNLARALLAVGKATDALPHAEAALAGHRASLGSDHPSTINAAQLVIDVQRASHLANKLSRQPR